jgi:hypothetical protein
MWGDDPNDYRTHDTDSDLFEERGSGLLRETIRLPHCERLTFDWVVDLRWVYQNSFHAVALIATGIRFTGDGWQECPQRVEDLVKPTVDELFRRYQENCIPKATNRNA